MPNLSPQQLADVKERFIGYLKERNLRQTSERLAIFDEIYGIDAHFDADELFRRLQAADIAVSRATVYNTLDLLVECNLVVRHQFGTKQATFERSFSFWQHDHLICLDCDHIHEFCDPRIQNIRDMMGDIFEFEITQHSLQLYGHCRKESCAYRAAAAAGG